MFNVTWNRLKGRAAYEAWRWQVRLKGDPNLPDWQTLLARERAVWSRARAAANGPVVLLAPSTGQDGIIVLNSLLAVALTLRGARVVLLLCDQVLPACERMAYIDEPRAYRLASEGPNRRRVCWDCYQPAIRFLTSLGLPVRHFSEFLTPTDTDEVRRIACDISPAEIEAYEENGLAIGLHAYAGALRYYKRGDLGAEPSASSVLRRYFEAALLTARVTDRLLGEISPQTAVFHHGIYVPQGILGEVCRQRGVGVVNWQIAYRKCCFIFSHDDTYHHTMMGEPVSLWEDMPWNERRESAILDYLESRRQGKRDWISFVGTPVQDATRIEAELPLDPSRPVIGLLTNVMWDAQLHYPANAFPSQLDWLRFTLDWFARRPDLQLVVRIHPAEVRGALASRQPAVEEIRKFFPELPKHIHIVPPESPLSTYALMERCDSVLIYGTKTGVELTARGIPVIVAGEAWIRNKGLTLDAARQVEYLDLLEQLPLGHRLDPKTVTRARKYAYHFFFRRMIEVPSITERQRGKRKLFDIGVTTLEELLPGSDPGLDSICDGILTGSPFVASDYTEPVGQERCS